jgi:hypothetical protein
MHVSILLTLVAWITVVVGDAGHVQQEVAVHALLTTGVAKGPNKQVYAKGGCIRVILVRLSLRAIYELAPRS